MFKLKEIASIIIISIIIAFSITLVETPKIFFYILLSIFLIVMINILSKKAVAYYLESEIEAKIWQLERWGLSGILLTAGWQHPSKKFKKAIPIGALLPIITKVIFLPLTNFVWMASLDFDIKTKVYRAAKRHNPIFSFSEITDFQIGMIASVGILTNLLAAIIIYFSGILPAEMDFVRLSLFYVFFNMIPISTLDGNRIFYANKTMWTTMTTLALIGLGYALLLV
jgi:Zn-dependent protease